MPKPIATFRPPHLCTSGRRKAGHNYYMTKAWRATRKAHLVRTAYMCAVCYRIDPHAHVDHVVPLADGGHDGHIQTLCASCHGKKTRAEQNAKGVGRR